MGGDKTREWLVKAILAGHSSDVRVRLRYVKLARHARAALRRGESDTDVPRME